MGHVIDWNTLSRSASKVNGRPAIIKRLSLRCSNPWCVGPRSLVLHLKQNISTLQTLARKLGTFIQTAVSNTCFGDPGTSIQTLHIIAPKIVHRCLDPRNSFECTGCILLMDTRNLLCAPIFAESLAFGALCEPFFKCRVFRHLRAMAAFTATAQKAACDSSLLLKLASLASGHAMQML